MSWLRVDDKMVRHEKVAPLSDAAFRLHFCALSYCSEYLTDGRVKSDIVEDLTRHKNKKDLIEKELVPRGLWEPIVGGWEIHDYLVWNPSRTDVEDRRKSARVRVSNSRGGSSGGRSGGSGGGSAPPAQSSSMAQHTHGGSMDVRANISRTDVERTGNMGRTESLVSNEQNTNPPRAGARGMGSGVEMDWEGPDRESTDAVPKPEPATDEPTYDLAWRLWREMYEGSKRRYGRYLEVPLKDERVIQQLAHKADELTGSKRPRTVETLRHWFASFLRDDGEAGGHLVNGRHRLSLILSRLPTYGEPRHKPAPLSGPRKAAEPIEQPVSPAEQAARAKALAAKLGGIGRPELDVESREVKAQ